MRKLILLFIFLSLFVTESYGYSCDQTFYGKLRLGYQYTFYDEFSNIGGNTVGLNSIDVNYTEQYDYNKSSSFPSFSWTPWITGKNYIVNPGESGKAIEASSTYSVLAHPATRSKENFVIQYKAKYYEKVSGVWNTNPLYHTECKYYEVTWCGDGVLDTSYGETCDPSDTSHNGWGAGGCDVSCKPITTQPTCSSITINPNTGTAPYSGTITCSGANNSAKYRIKQNGTTIYTGVSNAFNVNNLSNGTYNYSCFVIDALGTEHGSTACNKTLNVTNQACSAGVSGAQTAPISATTANLCNTSGYSVTNFASTVSGNTTNYTWSCTNGTTTLTGGNCNASYTPSQPTTCSAGVSGVLTAPIGATTANLCNTAGYSATNFKSTVSGNTTNYTWSCTNGTTTLSGGNCNASYTTNLCDSFFTGKLRYGHSYIFYDEFTNNGTNPARISNIQVTYKEQYDYNGSTDFPTFSWTPWFISKNYILNPGDSGKVIQANTAYPISYHPPVRGTDNLYIEYNAKYNLIIGGVVDTTQKYKKECINYEITWCGDGVLDSDEGETCDPNDTTHTGWGAGGCNASCQPITTQSCSAGVTGTQTSPITSSTPNLCNITGQTSTGFTSTASGNITNYTWSCTDGTKIYSGGNCNASYTSTTPVCSAGVTGTQTSPITSSTPNLCNITGQTSTGFTSTVSGDTTNYTWSCTNGTNTYSGGNCKANYTPPTGSSCLNGSVTGVQTSPVTASTQGLCQTGLNVGNFASTVSGNTTYYTWECGGIGGGGCNARYTPPTGSSCLNGSVTGVQTSPVTASTPGLCQTGLNVGNFASTVSLNTTYYTWECGGIGGGGCNARYTSGGGGGGSSCQNGGVYGIQTSPVTASTPGLCQAGFALSDFTSTISGNTTNYRWSCGLATGGNCYASYESSGPSSSSSSGIGEESYCGDGKVNRPNGNGFKEECDFGNESDWMYCNKETCTYKDSTIPGHCQDEGATCEITIPNEGSMFFGPIDNVVIGEGMNPYIAHSLGRPFVKNDSDYDLFIDKLCVAKKSGSTIIGYNQCSNAGIIHSGQIKYFPTTPNFVGGAVASGDYGDNVLITTIKLNDVLYGIDNEAYFVAPLKVRVGKSSIATVGGGISYIADTSTVGNISNIADNGNLNPDKNKNFVGVGVSTGSISSYTNKVNDTESVNTINTQGSTYTQKIDKVTNQNGTIVGDTSLLSDFTSYNGHSDVFILRNKNFVINSNVFLNKSGARTYIIENGNLTINTNIDYPDNIAFVVKGGDIEISKNVREIDGTYITIKKGEFGGSFKGTGGKTTDTLTINGSLYGNINNLVSNRTYIKQNSDNQIDVGTIVSFGSSLFRKTAPLLGTFIEEYMKSEKVSK